MIIIAVILRKLVHYQTFFTLENKDRENGKVYI